MKNQYVRVLRMGLKNVRVLLLDGSSKLISVDSFQSDWEQLVNTFSFTPNSYLDDLTFGLEIEFVGLKDNDSLSLFSELMNAITDNRFVCDPDSHHGSTVDHWVLGGDKSVISRRPLYRGYELTSPILHFVKYDMDLLSAVLNLIKVHLKGEVNVSCGLHVHVGSFYDLDKAKIGSVLQKYGVCERYMDMLVSRTRRFSLNRYCRTNIDTASELYNRKYIKLSSYRLRKYHTFECRHHQGTLDFDQILAWLELIGVLVKHMVNGGRVAWDSFELFLDGLCISDECKKYFIVHHS